MTFEFQLPDIGEGVTEGEIVGWLVKVGDQVTADQDMVEVMTDKATVTIGAPRTGKISEIRAQEGETVPVGQVLVVIDMAGGAAASAAGKPSAQADIARSSAASAVGDIQEALPGTEFGRSGSHQPAISPSAPAPMARESGPSSAGRAGGAPSSASQEGAHFTEKPLAAPKTRKLARELNVDLRRVAPTGAQGRVTDEDVRRVASGVPAAAPAAAAPAIAAREAVAREVGREAVAREVPVPVEPLAVPAVGAERRPIRGLRKRIFENMARSKRTAAHFTYIEECEMSALVALRQRLAARAERDGVKLTYLPFIVKATVAALKKHPALNTIVDDEKMEMVQSSRYDIGIAAATDSGLIVPVLRDADRLSLLDIAREIERLASEARLGKSRREDLGGSSFTITSLGKLGGLAATPVVNYPEVAILYVPEIKKKPVVKNDQIVIGHVMALSLSFDHRIIDGHVGAAFAQEIRGFLEDPDRLILEV